MIGHDPTADTAENYRRFAALQARGRSPLYESWASAVASDSEVLAFLAGLPQRKRQPNLLFAAVRWLTGTPASYTVFRSTVLDRAVEVKQIMLARRTQTNEPARCATLLPALAALAQPLALLEVGASAGLTLLPDCYSYDYAGRMLVGSDPAAPILRCQPRGTVHTPVPDGLPDVVWRAGIDLNPLDITDDADVAWLRCLIWPGEPHRQDRLTAAVAVARRYPPRLIRGDLVGDLTALAAEAPSHATLVIYHSAVLAYVDKTRREEFAAAVRDLHAVWLSNEGFGVLPKFGGQLPTLADPAAFVLVRDCETPLALTDPHGTWIQWLTA